MGILSFLRFRKREQEELLALWEDDYCQVEIVPDENLESIKKEIAAIENFSNQHRIDNGYTDIYVRESHPVQTKSKGILTGEIEKIFDSLGLTRVKSIKMQFEGSVDYDMGTTRAYQCNDFFIVYDFKDNIVSNIWLTNKFIKHANLSIVVGVFNTIGKMGFILVDWNSLEIINLTKEDEVKEYFMPDAN